MTTFYGQTQPETSLNAGQSGRVVDLVVYPSEEQALFNAVRIQE